jgi:hypothetical protein
MDRTALATYRKEVDEQLAAIERLSVAERAQNKGRKEGRRGNWSWAGISAAIFIGGFTAPVDGGALFWLIASGTSTQVGIMRLFGSEAKIGEAESRIVMLRLNKDILVAETKQIGRRSRELRRAG